VIGSRSVGHWCGLSLLIAAPFLLNARAGAQTAPQKLAPVDVGHGIQVTFDCLDVDPQTARWTATFSSSDPNAGPIQWDARTPGAPLTWTLGLQEGVGAWVFDGKTSRWPFALAYPCNRKAPLQVSVEPLPGYDWSGRRISASTTATSRAATATPPPVAAAAVGIDSGNGDPTSGPLVTASNMGQAGSTHGDNTTTSAPRTIGGPAPGDPAGVEVRGRDAGELFGEVVPGLDGTFLQQVAASSRDPAVMAPLLTGSIDERSNLEASSVGNCMRERPVFLQLMHQFDALHQGLGLKGSGLQPYGLTYASVPQADAVKASVLEAEIARYTWLCGEHTVSGEVLMRRAVSEYLLASTWARLAGSPDMFAAYKAAAFALIGHIARFSSIRGYTYVDVTAFCSRNAPDQSRFFPDGGGLLPADEWHRDCDSYPN
jgi:hypothetical protein